jgi:serine/threonine protein kinase
MKALKSQHVVRMYDFIEDSANYYIVLEFCPDGDLDHFINKKP